ncbi:MAG: bifunctional 5,10-methylenetetrahydrofolate dehydrogenase/5,10-methenyltetrahydrofolate cyclohydrolase [candidate division WOR-3 bacterium]
MLDGKAVAAAIRKELAQRVARLKALGVTPKLGVLLAGSFVPSQIYVRNKERACAAVGIEVETARFPDSVSIGEITDTVRRWNEDANVHGMIVQLPLPGRIERDAILELVDPRKDADGLTPANLGRLVSGHPRVLPATPAGIIELLVRFQIPIAGQRVVVIGRSELVGKPLANILLMRGAKGDATVTVCHTKTKDLPDICRQAQILIVAAGRAGLVTGEMVTPGVVVVDAGINRTEQGIVGDVDFDSVAQKARAITPVPGGVGPMTVAMLLVNTVMLAESRAAVQ